MPVKQRIGKPYSVKGDASFTVLLLTFGADPGI